MGVQISYRLVTFQVHVSQTLINDLRRCTNSGVAFAGERSIKEIESLQLGRVSPRGAGRPRQLR